MSRTLTIPDELYARLEATAANRGVSIQQMLEEWQAYEQEIHRRQEFVREVDALRENLFTTYGEMEDSVDLIRSDRAR